MQGGGTARRLGGRGLPLGRFSDGSSPASALWLREEGAGERALPEPAGERPSIVWGVGEMAPAVDRKGYWGPTTSTLDWCEENYVVTLFIAEFCEWSLRRGARARAEGRLVENAEGEPGCEGRLQAGPGSGCRACAAVGSRGADVAASCARAGFRRPSGWGRKGRTSRAWTAEESLRRTAGNRSSYLSAAAARPGTTRPEVGAEDVSAGRALNASPTAASRPQPARHGEGDAYWLHSPPIWETLQGPSFPSSLR